MTLATILRGPRLSAIAAFLGAGCAAAPNGHYATTSSPTSSAEFGCTTVGEESVAVSGVIRAGPFLPELRPDFTSGPGGKLWVGSTTPGPRMGATLIAQGVADGTIVRQHRPAEPVSTVSGLALFYPGVLRLAATGTWRLTVQIGSDTGCFLFQT